LSPVVLASTSEIRGHLLREAGVPFSVTPAGIDEDTVKESLLEAGASPREIAIALAELKAQKVSAAHPGALVIGADQVLVFHGKMVSKSKGLAELRDLLKSLSGNRHELISAAALAREGALVWRAAATVKMQMRDLSDTFLDRYIAAHGRAVLGSVGGYRFEAEGAQLFVGYSGDYFAILGLPLLLLLNALREFGVLPA
jgi:septum formation protein